MPLDDGQSSAQRYTPESTLDIMAEYIRGGLPLSSCHTQVAHWIKNEENLQPDDEIVMFGDTLYKGRSKSAQDSGGKPVIMHSLIMRDNEIIADPFKGGVYNPDQETYMSGGAGAAQGWEYKELYRIPIIDFLKEYGIVPPDFDPDADFAGPETGEEPSF